jgi:tRNA1(Val) A37 N6-methylase TrmN6
MTRRPSSLSSTKSPHHTLEMGAGYKFARDYVCTHRPSPSLEVRFPLDKILRRAVWGEKTGHPAMMHGGLLLELVRLYTAKGETILDPFGGVGTTALAVALERSVVLCEIEKPWCDVARAVVNKSAVLGKLDLMASEIVPRDRLKFVHQGAGSICPDRSIVLNIDSRDLNRAHNLGQVDCIISSPPYLDTFGHPSMEGVLKTAKAYTQDHQSLNLARVRNRHFFRAGLGQVYKSALQLLKVGGLIVLVTKDVVRNGLRVPFALENILMLEALGCELLDWWRRDCIPSLFANIQRAKNPDSARVDLEDVLVFRYTPGEFVHKSVIA